MFRPDSDAPNWKDVAPRLSLVYDIFGTGKTALKFSANRYNQGIGSDYQFRVNPLRSITQTCTWTDNNPNRIPELDEFTLCTGFNFGLNAQGQLNTRYDPAIKRPYSNELSAEIEQQIAQDIPVFGGTVLSIGYYHRETRRNLGAQNLAIPRESYIPLTLLETISGKTVTVYNQAPALRGVIADSVWNNYDTLDGQFNGVDVSFNKRMSNHWMVMGGLSYGHQHGDTSGTNDLNNPNSLFRHGTLSSDVPWSFKMSPFYEAPFGVHIGGNIQHFTGTPETDTVLVTSTTQP